MVATAAQWDRGAWFGEEEHESSAEIVMMHTDISRTYVHAGCRLRLNMDGWECHCTALAMRLPGRCARQGFQGTPV